THTAVDVDSGRARLAPCVMSYLFSEAPPPAVYTLSLHDALPISWSRVLATSSRWTSPRIFQPSPSGLINSVARAGSCSSAISPRSEEHTSELQSRENLVCRLLLEKKKDRTAPGFSSDTANAPMRR